LWTARNNVSICVSFVLLLFFFFFFFKNLFKWEEVTGDVYVVSIVSGSCSIQLNWQHYRHRIIDALIVNINSSHLFSPLQSTCSSLTNNSRLTLSSVCRCSISFFTISFSYRNTSTYIKKKERRIPSFSLVFSFYARNITKSNNKKKEARVREQKKEKLTSVLSFLVLSGIISQ
jgi:hypothetical protein